MLYVLDDAGEVRTITASPACTMPVVTGAKGGNVALTSLLSALAGMGYIADQTT